jgi:hypothetical protein
VDADLRIVHRLPVVPGAAGAEPLALTEPSALAVALVAGDALPLALALCVTLTVGGATVALEPGE